MATSVDTILHLEDQLASLGTRIRTRKMFGEYALYCDEKVVALICDDQVFVKITDKGKEYIGRGYQEGFPYQGAKPAMVLDDDIVGNPQAFCELITITAAALPLPKVKRKKARA